MGLVKCPKCGQEINDTDQFCTSCGYEFNAVTPPPVEGAPAETPAQAPAAQTAETPTPVAPAQNGEKKKTNGFAIAGFVLSLVGLLIAGIICGPLAIIFSGISLSQIKEKNQGGQGLAIAGLIIGIIDTVAMIFYYASGMSLSSSILPFM